MEMWKKLEGMDNIFSISNKKRIHQEEYNTTGMLFGKEVPVRQPEKYYDGNLYKSGIITIQYKNLPYMFDINEEMKKYFTEDEIADGLESEFTQEVIKRNLSLDNTNEIKVKSLPDERWLPIPNFEGYEVSDMGRVKRLANTNINGTFYPEHIVKTFILNDALMVTLWDIAIGKQDKEVAQLVANAFLPNPKHYCNVSHLNGDIEDNCLENLKWFDDTPNCFYECVKTGEKYTLTEICEKFNISPNEFRIYLNYGKEIDGHVFVEKRNSMISSNGSIGKCTIVKEATREPIKIVRKYTKHIDSISNPIKPSNNFVPPTNEAPLKNPLIIESFKVKDEMIKKILGERWKDIPNFPDYCVSSNGRVKRKASFINGRLQKESIETPYEKDGLMWVKLINSEGVKEKIVERLVANAFVYNNRDYYVIEHKDSDFKNNIATNLKWIDATISLYCVETGKKMSINNVAEELNCSMQDLYTNVLENDRIENYTLKTVTLDTNKKEKENEMENEIWKMIKDSEKNTEISNKGNVRRKIDGVYTDVRCGKYNNGSKYFYDGYTTRIVAREVAIAFLPNPNNYPFVKNVNGDRNNNAVENLMWYSRKTETNIVKNTNIKEKEIWKPYPKMEGLMEISNLGNIKTLARDYAYPKRHYDEKIHKPQVRVDGSRKLPLTINGYYMYIDIDKMVKEVFESESVKDTVTENGEIWKNIETLANTEISNHYRVRSFYKGKYKILATSLLGNKLRAQRTINGKNYSVDVAKEVEKHFTISERVIPEEYKDFFRSEQLPITEQQSFVHELSNKVKEVTSNIKKTSIDVVVNMIQTILDNYEDYSTKKIKFELNELKESVMNIKPNGNVISDEDFKLLNNFKELAKGVK